VLAVVGKTPVFGEIGTQNRIAARVLINSAVNAAVRAYRRLRHNVPLNVYHRVPWLLDGEVFFANRNGPGHED